MSEAPRSSGLTPAELLELVIAADGERTPALEAYARDATACRELRELEDFIRHARSCLGSGAHELSPQQEESLVQRVLALTSAEDLRWRGDLRLVGSFVSERLRSSGVLRVAAASLLLHLAALPVLAWYVFLAPEPEPDIWIHLPTAREESPFAGSVEPEAEPKVASDMLPGLPQEANVWPEADEDAHASLRRARALLISLGKEGAPDLPSSLGEGAALGPVEGLLAARARCLRGAPAELTPRLIVDDSDALQRALLAELLLDRYVLTGLGALEIRAALGEVDLVVAPATGGLLSLTRARAVEYGLVGAPRDGPSLDGSSELLGVTWRAALAAALKEGGADGPAARAWRLWAGEGER